MALTKDVRQQIDDLVNKNRVVLFMKGNRQFPQCGFSVKAIGMLDELVRTYETVNVLEDLRMRDGIKEYAQWPTVPQLYIDGQFVGGCDLVTEVRASGKLQRLLCSSTPWQRPRGALAGCHEGCQESHRSCSRASRG